ncbi:MAG: hypothetical protein HN390_03410 [Anaerolineae bacterium]|jgi:hypothetical protein|nr:hypothetical protein [Anaerolineae bacterium]MBT7990477.1 hypothetical protein [Anaerolineae bacterium]
MKKHIPSFLLVIALLLIPISTVHADMGPKPEMTFEFQLPDQAVTIVSGILYECDQPDCSDAVPLEEMGPQRFECDARSCYSMAYGYRAFFQLDITLSNGESFKSNIFTKTVFAANYIVTMAPEGDRLIVEEEGQDIPLLPLVLTLFIELLLAFLYVVVVNKDIHRKRFLLGILAINLITQPFFTYVSVVSENMGMGIFCLFAEMAIFFVEAVFIYFYMKKELSFGKALILSFVFNFASFFIGLFLSV